LTVVAPAAFKLARVLVEVLDTTDKVVGTAPRSTEPVVVTPFSVRVSDVATGVTNEPLVCVKDVPLPANVTEFSAPELAVAAAKLFSVIDEIVPAAVVEVELTSAIVTAPAAIPAAPAAPVPVVVTTVGAVGDVPEVLDTTRSGTFENADVPGTVLVKVIESEAPNKPVTAPVLQPASVPENVPVPAFPVIAPFARLANDEAT
jgi:hypothetical protein